MAGDRPDACAGGKMVGMLAQAGVRSRPNSNHTAPITNRTLRGAREGTRRRSAPSIELTPDGGRRDRYVPRWIGGGLEKPILQAISKLAVGDRIRVDWIYDVRKRALRVVRPGRPGTGLRRAEAATAAQAGSYSPNGRPLIPTSTPNSIFRHMQPAAKPASLMQATCPVAGRCRFA